MHVLVPDFSWICFRTFPGFLLRFFYDGKSIFLLKKNRGIWESRVRRRFRESRVRWRRPGISSETTHESRVRRPGCQWRVRRPGRISGCPAGCPVWSWMSSLELEIQSSFTVQSSDSRPTGVRQLSGSGPEVRQRFVNGLWKPSPVFSGLLWIFLR